MAEAAYILNRKPEESWEWVLPHFVHLSSLGLPLSRLIMVSFVCVMQRWGELPRTPGALCKSSHAHLHLQPSLAWLKLSVRNRSVPLLEPPNQKVPLWLLSPVVRGRQSICLKVISLTPPSMSGSLILEEFWKPVNPCRDCKITPLVAICRWTGRRCVGLLSYS